MRALKNCKAGWRFQIFKCTLGRYVPSNLGEIQAYIKRFIEKSDRKTKLTSLIIYLKSVQLQVILSKSDQISKFNSLSFNPKAINWIHRYQILSRPAKTGGQVDKAASGSGSRPQVPLISHKEEHFSLLKDSEFLLGREKTENPEISAWIRETLNIE